MQFKLDENLGKRFSELLMSAGHQVSTVYKQNMCGFSDKDLIEICKLEQRCLVTLDTDFSNPFIFPPQNYFGIVVLRLGKKTLPEDLEDLMNTLIDGLKNSEVTQKLWVIQTRGKIREYHPQG